MMNTQVMLTAIHKLYPAMIVTVIWIAYTIAWFMTRTETTYYGKKIKTNRYKLIDGWVVLGGIIVLYALWSNGIPRYRQESLKESNKEEYVALDNNLKNFFNEVINRHNQCNDFFSVPEGMIEEDHNIDYSHAKMIAVASGKSLTTQNDTVWLEERLNNKLKECNQFETNTSEIDYVIFFFRNWKTDIYESNNFVSTENAFVMVVNYHTGKVVATKKITPNLNPNQIERRLGERGTHQCIYLDADILAGTILSNQNAAD